MLCIAAWNQPPDSELATQLADCEEAEFKDVVGDQGKR